MAASTLTLAASPAARERPTVSSMTKRKLQLVVGVILLVVWIVSVALVGFVVRHGGSLRSSMPRLLFLPQRSPNEPGEGLV